MVTQVLDGGLVRTQGNYNGWAVTTIESSHGIARVECRGDLTDVFVGETWAGSSSDAPCRAYCAVACTSEGDALVLAREAPPLILATRTGHRTSPIEPGQHSLEHLVPGERLVMLSSSTFEFLPERLANLLREPPSGLLGSDPASLLAEIFSPIGQGAGAIVERQSTPPGGHP